MEFPETNNDGSMGKPLFSCNTSNFAWGKVAKGYVLDHQGRIWFYDLGDTWTPHVAGNGLFFESGLRARFKNPVRQIHSATRAQLAIMRKKAKIARGGRIEKKHVGFDAGGCGCEAYLWETPDTYREVELGSSGDYEITNSSPEANEITQWLIDELKMGIRRKPQLDWIMPKINKKWTDGAPRKSL